jgi:hypothetical protein
VCQKRFAGQAHEAIRRRRPERSAAVPEIIMDSLEPHNRRLQRYARALQDGIAILRKCPWGAMTRIFQLISDSLDNI